MVFKEIIVAGCGNPLFADDGFGPAIVERLQKVPLPENVMVIDAGTSAPYFIFPLLDPDCTKKLVIIDIADFGGKPGSVISFGIEGVFSRYIHDAQIGGIAGAFTDIPQGIETIIVACQPGRVTYPELEIGLSDEVERAIPLAVQAVLNILGIGERDTGREGCTRGPGSEYYQICTIQMHVEPVQGTAD